MDQERGAQPTRRHRRADPGRRRREREREEKKPRQRSRGGRTRAAEATASDGSAPTAPAGSSSTGQTKLSRDALALLNEHNVRNPPSDHDDDRLGPESGGRSQTRRATGGGGRKPPRRENRECDAALVDAVYETPAKTERRRRSRRRYESADEAAGEARQRRRRRRSRPKEGDGEKTSQAGRRRARVPTGDDGQDGEAERRGRRAGDAEDESGYHPPRRTDGRERGGRGPGSDGEATATDERTADDVWRGTRRRHVSGAIVEEGRARPATTRRPGPKYGSYDSLSGSTRSIDGHQQTPPPAGKKKTRKYIIAAVSAVLLIVIIVIAVVASKKKQAGASADKADADGRDEDGVPVAARGTYLDPSTWYDRIDFNTTYTNHTVGDLPTIGLFTDWEDSGAANDRVPALNKAWGSYETTPARGVNLGGWLSLEPFITPSLFDYDARLGIVDEWTLCRHLGAAAAAATLEKHYATFVTEQDVREIAAAGLDHVRIPYSYWAVQVYDDDPYVFRTSWRYLLRAIEWCRRHGLRVNLDLHALPGSQNGWSHSGRQGDVGWLNGTDGDLNARRSLEVHDRLSSFFAQERYRNIIAFYGLANEPKMVSLAADAVVGWTEQAHRLVRSNGLSAAHLVFGDGFMGLANWRGRLAGLDGLVLDVHQYVIFNRDQIVLSHQAKVEYACHGWTEQTQQSMDRATGFGPTLFAEWSQADTDCARHLTNVGWGNRWEGSYASGNGSTEALTPRCPTRDRSCSCADAVAPPARWSAEYRRFLRTFAEAQMASFENGWGWWYWTWDTESAPLWSYRQGRAAGVLPVLAYERTFACDGRVPDFAAAGLPETY